MPPKGRKVLSATTDRVKKTSKTATGKKSASTKDNSKIEQKLIVRAPPSASSNMPVTTATSPSASATPSKDDDPVYFWRPHEPHGYLGQWYSSPFTVDGETYATAEMWMMVQKARLFGDEEIAKEMLATTDPKTHKALGRAVRGFEEGVWNKNKLRIVEEGTYHKFTLSSDAATLRKQLLETGDRELVEASPRDRIWGIGFGEKNAGKMRYRWGLNLLGKALMNVRGRLREEEEGEKKE